MKAISIEQWAAAEVAAAKPVPAPKGVTEDAIAEKVSVGLTRGQAIAVIQRQMEADAAAARATKKGGK